ncbi:MAG: insulinase family protein [Spirochaetia bacterium]
MRSAGLVDTGRHDPYIHSAMKTRDRIGAFDVLSRREIPEYRARGVHLRHTRTGCEVVHLETADTENLFAFCFATPPRDDTGVSHIIEHSVLSGSRLYPLKEPFSALMKGSMHTFLNALTYPDRTVYPAASCNRADFFNVLSVYGDAVFHPLLRKETFMQEAWRLEEGGGSDGMKYAGIVYNEMKGVYSSPDSLVAELTTRSLFPDTPYRFDSGGDPRSIPSLTLESAREFHARYYHPSNCRIFLYGDIPVQDVLAFLEEKFLSDFTASRIDADIPLQKRWDSPRRLEKTYPVKPDTPLDGRTSVTVSWLLPAVTDSVALVTHEVLSEVLIESAGSPLRKALVDSGLGEDLSPVSGLETDLKEMIFAVGLRGSEPDREKKIESLVLDTLRALSKDGLERKLVQSMINRVEFRHREIRGSGSPYALRLMGRALRGWVHGMDPFSSLEFTASMKELKARLAGNSRYLEECLDRGFFSNPHRLTLLVRPDRGQEAREAEEDKARLDAAIRRLSAEQLEAVRSDARLFRTYQLAPDSPQSLALIPSLRRTDLPREVEKIPIHETRTPAGVPLALHDIFTNEIVYVDLAFPTDALAGELSLMLPLFGKTVCGTGLPGLRYDQVALELFRLTGGFSASLDAGGIVGQPEGFGQYAFFRFRCLRQNLPESADLVARLLQAADFRDLARLRDILVELRNDMKAALVPGGHQFAMLRAASMLSASVAREEEWRGITQLLFLEGLVEGIDERLPRIAARLEEIRRALLVRPRLIANATAGSDSFEQIARAVDAIAAGCAARPPAGEQANTPPQPVGQARQSENLRAESFLASASVGYIARAVPGFHYEHPMNGPGAVLGHLLSTGYLWEKVRMEGGAYGAFSYPRNTDGLFLFGSYRDPHITHTLHAFRDGLELMENGELPDTEVEKAIIGTIGREDRPIDPGEKGFVSLQRKLHGVTDAARQARRDRLLAVDRRAVGQAAAALQEGFERGFTAIIANRQTVADAAAEMPELGRRVVDLPE